MSARADLWNEDPPKPGTRMRKGKFDPMRLSCQSARDVLNVAPTFCQISHSLINVIWWPESGSRRFDELGAAAAGIHDRRLIEIKRSINLTMTLRPRSFICSTTIGRMLKNRVTAPFGGIKGSKPRRHPRMITCVKFVPLSRYRPDTVDLSPQRETPGCLGNLAELRNVVRSA